MDDPTKDLIPRSSIEYCLRKETVSTNPDAYEAHEKFIAYMDDPEISQFGRWMLSNGINVALTAIKVDLNKIPSTQPERKTGYWQITESYPHNVYCSECHTKFAQTHWAVWEDGSLPRKFCPNCGAKMEE